MPATAAPSAAATAVAPLSGTPSTIQIKQNFLSQQLRAVNSQIKVAEQCIANASRPEVLRDPEGNVNIVPSIDITNCTRTLQALLRQLASLNNQANRLAQDAQVAAQALQAQQKAQSQNKSTRTRRIVRGKVL